MARKKREQQIFGFTIVGAIIVLAILFAGFKFSIVGSSCKDVTPYATVSSDGNIVTFETPSFYGCSQSGTTNDQNGGECWKLPLNLEGKKIVSYSVDVMTSKVFYSRWTNTGADTGEYYTGNVYHPTYTGSENVSTIINGGSLTVHNDGIEWNTAATDGSRNYRWCCSGVCAYSGYSTSGTITLADVEQPVVPPTGEVTGGGGTTGGGTTGGGTTGGGTTGGSTGGTAAAPESLFMIFTVIGIVLLLIIMIIIWSRRKK